MPYYLMESMLLSFIFATLGIRSWIILLVLASTFIQVDFLFGSSIYTWAPDIGGHTDYIQYLVNHSYMPPSPAGWQRQQPFLYYEWCALAFNTDIKLGLNTPWFAVRVASRALYLGYIIFSILLIERFHFPTLAKSGAVSAILFWPSAYLISTRTNSDIGFMFFFMASLFFLQLWNEKLLHKHLNFSIICAGLSLLCKATGIITLVMIIAVLACALLTGRIQYRYFRNRVFIWPVTIAALCLTLYFGRIGYYNFMKGANLQWFANIKSGGGMVGTASPYSLVYFNIRDFLQHPVFSGNAAEHNRYTFWDFMFRTLLYGTEIKDGPPIFYGIINIFWIGILSLSVWQILKFIEKPEISQEYLPLVSACVLLIIGAMIQRCLVPDNWLSHGRRIYPIVTILIILATARIHQQRRAGKILLYVLFSLGSLGFSITSGFMCIYNNFP